MTPSSSPITDERSADASSVAVTADDAVATGAVAFGLRPIDLAVALVALVLCLGHVPTLLFPSWTLRFAVLLAVLPVGLLCLGRLAVRRDAAALWATAFLIVALVSGALADVPYLSLLGFGGADTFWLLYLGVIGLWAWGRSLDATAARVLELTVVGALAVNVVWAALQMAFDVEGGTFNVHPGRASGFFSNPAYYAAAMSAGLGWAILRRPSNRRLFDLAAVGFFAFGLALSGSRLAFGTAFVALAAGAWVIRSRRVVATWAAAVVGFALGGVVTSIVGGRDSVTRIAEDGDGRSAVWRIGLDAWRDRPIIGWGLGQQRAAMQAHMSETFSVTVARDDAWSDPHNLAVLLLVTTGLLGVVAAVGFGFTAVRSSRRSPFLAMALLIGLNYCLQPATIHSFPLALLLLGAAGAADARPEQVRPRWVVPTAGAVGVIVGLVSIVPAYQFRAGLIDGDTARMEAATWWYHRDAYVADQLAIAYSDRARDGAASAADVTEWAERTIEAEPDRAYWRVRSALREIEVGDVALARTNLDRALELHPWNVGAHEAMYLLAIITGDGSLQDETYRMLCRLESEMCDGALPTVDPATALEAETGEPNGANP